MEVKLHNKNIACFGKAGGAILRPCRSNSVLVHAGPRRRPPPNPNQPNQGGPKRPERGFFADADPKAEIYPVRSSLQGDVTKRGGRWQSDFIWNSNWQEALEYEEAVKRQVEEGRKEAEEAANKGGDGKGFLSLTSKVDLNSMDVDLSAQLKPRPRNYASASSNAQQQRRLAASAGGYPAVPATRGEERAWDRSGRYSRKVIATPSTVASAEELAAKQAAELERYDQLKQELQAWALGLTAACLAATYVFYGRDIAASYGVGALGGLFYLRLLHRSVDSVGAGGLGGALGSNRLLIPLILALGYNRYNQFVAEDTGLTLQLLPMLVGFFTYKGAVIARQSLALFDELTGKNDGNINNSSSEANYGANAGESGQGGDFDVTSVDRAFNSKMLRG